MEIINELTDETILNELGSRIKKRRIQANITQEMLSYEAGISKRTIERLESGESVQLNSFIRILRALDLLSLLEASLPRAKAGPIELLRNRGKERKRAFTKRTNETEKKEWVWGDDK